MRWVKLGDICQVVSGSTPKTDIEENWNGSINWFTPKDLSKLEGKFVYDSPTKITEVGLRSCSSTLMPAGTLLFTSRAPIGHIAITTEEACTNQGFKSLIPGKEVDVNYLYYAIKFFTPHLQNLGNGATFKELAKPKVSNFEIPLPSIEKQRQIAQRLDLIDRLRQSLRAELAAYGALGEAVFLEMFGDPFRETSAWPKKEIQKIANVSSGSTPSRSNPSFYEGDILWVKTGEVINKIILDTAEKITQEAINNSSCRIYPKDSILIAMYGQGKTRGQVGMLGVPASTNQACAVIEPSDKFIPVYLFELLKNSYDHIRSLGRGGNQENLNGGMIKQLKIPLPPLPLQQKFAARIRAIEALRGKAELALGEADGLFGATLQRVFGG